MIKYIEADEMPEEGQFVVVWTYDGQVWSGTYKREGGCILEYIDGQDSFVECEDGSQHAWVADADCQPRFFSLKHQPSSGELIDRCRLAANAVSSVSDDRGMAMVSATYHPYLGEWLAKASWSDGKEIVSSSDTSAKAALADLLVEIEQWHQMLKVKL